MAGEQQEVLDALRELEPHRRREASEQRGDRPFRKAVEADLTLSFAQDEDAV